MNEKDKCLGCYARALQIEYLKMQLALKEREIQRLRRIIAEAKKTAGAIQSEADQIMSEHRPRAVWSFAKGARTAAARIGQRLAC